MLWSTSQVNNECHDQEANDGEDLDTGKHKFGFSIDLNRKDVQADNHGDDNRDPDSHTDVLSAMPVLNDYCGR